MGETNPKVTETIRLLNAMLQILKDEIDAYKDVDDRAKLGDPRSMKAQAFSKKSLAIQVENIDRLIMNEPEIKSLIGSLDENAEIQELNRVIASVLGKVAEIKEFKDRNGNKITELKNAGKKVSLETETEKLVSKVNEFKDREFVETDRPTELDAINSRIQELEEHAIEENTYATYLTVRAELAAKESKKPEEIGIDDVAIAAEEFVEELKEKLNAYRLASKAQTIDIDVLKKINARTTIINNPEPVKKIIDFLKSVNPEIEITVGTTNIKIKDLKLKDLTDKNINQEEMKKAIEEMCTLCEAEQTKLPDALSDLKDTLSNNISMKMFPADKAKIEEELNKPTVDVEKVESLLNELLVPGGKNLTTLVELESYNPSEASKVQAEIKRLKALKIAIAAEQTAQTEKTATEMTPEERRTAIERKVAEADAYGIKVQEMTSINVLGTNIPLKRSKLMPIGASFVSLNDEEIIKSMLLGSFNFDGDAEKGEMNVDARINLKKAVEEKYKSTLPTETVFHKLGAWLRGKLGGDERTRRQRAIDNLLEEEMKTSFVNSKNAAHIARNNNVIGRMETEIDERQNQAQTRLNNATQAKNDVFRLDDEKRKQVNAAAREAARQSLLRNESREQAEKAFNEAGKNEAERE